MTDTKHDAKHDELKVSPHDVELFEQKIRSRTDPFTYLSTNYKFEPMDSPNEIVICSVLRALFGCSTFVDKMRQNMSEPIATEIRKFISKLSYGKKNQKLDVRNLQNELVKVLTRVGNIQTNNNMNRCGELISALSKIWSTSRFRKLFAITRIITGYCVACKYTRQYRSSDFSPYVITRRQVFDPEFDLEDSLYAERVLEKHKCEKCNTVTDYSVMVTTNAPDVLTIVSPKNMRYNFPNNITLPCEETRTHYYTLASFIYILTKDDRVGVCIRTGENNYLSHVHRDNRVYNNRPPNNLVKQYDLLCYVKVASIDNFSRVLE